jgi:two-component system NarL family sensor kinase
MKKEKDAVKSSVNEPRNKARERADDLVSLSRVSAAISSFTDLEAILRVGLDSVLGIIDGAVGGIMLIDDDTKMLSYRVYHGLSDKYAREMRLRLGEGIAGRSAQTGKAILLEDISLEPEAAHPDLIDTEGLKGFASIPLRAKEHVVGVMNVASHRPRRFTKKDLHLLGSIGDQLGIAIEQSKLYEQLRKGRERYRQLARQVLLAQEDERRRIARELHDETSQALTGLALNLQVLIETAGVQDSEFKARLQRAHSLAVQIGSEVSRLIADLRPSLLDTLGLVPAIRQYAETNLNPLGINISFEFGKIEGSPLPGEVEVGLFRWAQVVVGNIVQHSQAKNATISLKQDGDELVLRISDDGKGFDVSHLTSIEEGGRGAGLFSGKERVRLLGGDCLVESQPGQGTTTTARIPMVWSMNSAEDKSISGR